MLPQKRRISRKEFPDILKKGRRFNSPHLLLYVVEQKTPVVEHSSLRDKADFISLFSFSVSKKISKKAVDRNRLRRQGYSVITSQIKNIKKGFLFFFSFKKESGTLTFVQLEKEIKDLLKVGGVLL